MAERKQQDRDDQEQRRHDELKLPEERVEDLEPEADDAAEVKGGVSLNYSKITTD